MALSVKATRTELSLADLELNSGNYRWDKSALVSGGVVWARKYASAPYVDGDTLVSRRKSHVFQQAHLIVTGSTPDNMRSNVDTVIDAISQFAFDLIFDPDVGTSWTWTCDSADYLTPIEQIQNDRLITELTLVIPRRPDPFAGSLH